VTTAVQAEVFAGNADPLEVLGGGEHLLNELVVLVLDPLPLDQGLARFRHAIGEAVADRLQLTEIEHPRRGGDGLDAMGNLRVAKSLADEAGELRLEPGDLPAQLQPRLALVDRNAQPVEFPLSQQSRHPQKV
jgi:hypothetical protein